MPTLFIFAGLPGVGKTSLSQRLAQEINAVHLRIDTIEQGLRDLCGIRVEGEGYRLAYRIAADNLRLGIDVVSDSCNPLELTRREWEHVASNNSAMFVNIEVICSNQTEHRRRVESSRVIQTFRNCDCPHGETLKIANTTSGQLTESSLTRRAARQISHLKL